ncbi:MAG TPA: peptidoglycan-binding domain-containing protein [Candidatus Acidoferrum sp.]|nr:peptidoglycan-binding domain-containing protein [Candidatus Acidoferrum sp.]
MRLRKTIHWALALLLAAGPGVSAASAQSQKAPKKKTVASRSRSSAHRTKVYRKSRRRERGQKVPTPDRISEIQQALAKDGSFTGTPNGKWDDSTMEAMKKFQESHGLSPSGKLDAKTLQQLGLGSQTAGVAPPLPPAGSAATIVAPGPAVPRRQ